jgi:hypothetical protein
MPSSPNYKRDYKQEVRTQKKRDATKADPKGTRKRVARNKARTAAIKAGKVSKGNKKVDIGHKKALKNGGSKKLSNTKTQSASSNRSHGGRIGSRAGKAAGGRKGKR